MHNCQLTHRHCPNCSSNNYQVLIALKPDDFVQVNPTYDLNEVAALGLSSNYRFAICRCKDCGFQYSLEQLPVLLLERLYVHVIDSEKSRTKIITPSRRLSLLQIWFDLFSLLARDLGEVLDVSVFDYGCGWGDFLSVAQSPGIRVVGFDMDRRKVEYARQVGVSVVESLDDVDRCSPFDVIVCNQVLEHLPDPHEAVARLNRWLKMGRFGYISVPNCDAPYMKNVSKALAQGRPIPKEVNPWEHLNYFTPESLEEMLGRHGFTIISIPHELQRLSSTCLRHSKGHFVKTRLAHSLSTLFRAHSDKSSSPSSTSVYVQKVREDE